MFCPGSYFFNFARKGPQVEDIRSRALTGCQFRRLDPGKWFSKTHLDSLFIIKLIKIY
jgi:hypothetical protein